MKQVIFEYVAWQHNSATIYTALNDINTRITVPTIIRLTDGFSLVCCPSKDSKLAPTTMIVGPAYEYIATEPAELETAPVVGGISENTLLKALAITRDATLALQLIKD